ncbi:AAA family ATPase [Spirillospora sp. NPDC000708]
MILTGRDSQIMQFPLVQRVKLSNFSLYRNKTENIVELGEGVFCLVGANGLGKSTFLSIINYGITGIVASSRQKILSLSEYYRHSLPYAAEYFTGRINQRDREIAEVTLDFSVGDYNYTVTRGFFDPASLRRLVVSGPGVDVDKTVDFEDNAAGSELHDHYKTLILEHTGLAQFEQLVFLQHFLLTFDERRHLLFWDAEVARFALYLVFGLDAAKANQASEWQRKADKLESQARNAQYQATAARDRKARLINQSDVAFEADTDLEDQHELLENNQDILEQQVAEKAAQEKDARLAVSTAVASHHALSVEYNRLFGQRLNPGLSPSHHPLVARLLSSAECGVCGSSGVDTAEIQGLVDSEVCPLCRTAIEAKSDNDAGFERLEALDEQLLRSQSFVEEKQATLERVSSELSNIRQEYLLVSEQLARFEEDNSLYLSRRTAFEASANVRAMIQQCETEQSEATRRRDDFRRRRDEYKALLEPLQRELAETYALAERDFVPRFQSLAHAFLGLDLTLVLEQRARGPQLVVSIDGNERRESDQLSESQRYFIDIALRMALSEFMVPDDSPACLYIDTPEGSLDIAYERRAGEMFGRFVTRGNRLLMTANLNSSRLVLELAGTCRRQLMHVERMTTWAVLSEVQADAEDLFDESFHAIEDCLNGGGHGGRQP